MLSNTSLLIIEDQPEICDLIKLSFANRIPTIQLAHSLAEAAELIKETSFTLMIVDVYLPDGDPYPLILKMLQKKCRVLLMSGNFQINQRINDLPFPRIEKPFRIKNLIKKVEETVSNPLSDELIELAS
ncbi:response regulator [Commensalibacter melissae]|uniref:Response regulatory domain-containing protein n=1 Tax=Commensalibacter melissae TaxID=2070537 RepID=A0A318N7T1_9PROT|nr:MULTISPECIES: response regulator [Commensalibacter]AYN87295.1 response regulator [Commensalibacter melissae]MBH9969146.1 response regulator [Commensalibacter sp. M0265]MBH9976501.1 response regulator [Commensalibacter sp. M0266]MBH9992562.1 response regulator [Commensalibacter sp. M0270]MBI0045677.1 response regulator [Commensalibacter sp. M0267]